jgi:multiple sugar transport system substrate-binding protein
MVMLSSNQFQALSNVASESGITLELATIPRVYADGQSGMVVRSSQEMSMWKGSENKEMAANFMNFFVNSIEANRILNCERGVSINSDVLAALKADTELTNEVTAKVYTIEE